MSFACCTPGTGAPQPGHHRARPTGRAPAARPRSRGLVAAALSVALVLACSGAVAQLPAPMSELELRSLLLARGFSDIEAVEFDDGMWSATAEAPDGGRAALHVHPQSGAILLDDVEPALDADTIEERLLAVGFRDVHNPVFEDGVWKVEAEDPQGRELLVYVEPTNGTVLGTHGD